MPAGSRGLLRSCCHPAIISDVPARGKFITFEGLDGSGKSTQVEKLARSLRAHGLSVTITREPGGTTTGEKIREVLLHSATSGLSPLTEMALMFASRAQHIHEVILPALAEGRIVLCDRFTDSTEAYQGGGRKLGSKPVLEMHEILCGNLQPDLTVLLDNEVAFSVERARRRNRKHKGARSEKGAEKTRTVSSRKVGLFSDACAKPTWQLRPASRSGCRLSTRAAHRARRMRLSWSWCGRN